MARDRDVKIYRRETNGTVPPVQRLLSAYTEMRDQFGPAPKSMHAMALGRSSYGA